MTDALARSADRTRELRVLRFRLGCGIERSMLQAYVGIVSRRGLERFYREDSETVQCLRRRAHDQPGRMACVWSVVAEEVAGEILAALRLGRSQEALDLLREEAREGGPLAFEKWSAERPAIQDED